MTGFGCVVTAAGRGERLGAGLPKALVRVGDVPMLARAVELISAEPRISAIVVTAPADDMAAVGDLLRAFDRVTVVAGGDTRTASVRNGVAVLPDGLTGILVHDAARPFVPLGVVGSVIDAIAAGEDGAVPGLPVVDTIKEIDDGGVIVSTPNRSHLRAIQTPQGFRADLLRRALELPEDGATDDAGMVERLGADVRVVPGHPDGLKITTPDDLVRAEEILLRRSGDSAG